MSQQMPAPGWYPEPGTSHLRWWDGSTWGPYAPSQAPPDKTLAVLSHLGAVIGGFILPLIIYLTAGKRDAYIRHHSAEALNFQLTWLIGFLTAFVLMFSTLFATAGLDSSEPPVGFFIIFPFIFVIQGIGLVFSIMGAVKAGGGKLWRYPVSIRFVKAR